MNNNLPLQVEAVLAYVRLAKFSAGKIFLVEVHGSSALLPLHDLLMLQDWILWAALNDLAVWPSEMPWVLEAYTCCLQVRLCTLKWWTWWIWTLTPDFIADAKYDLQGILHVTGVLRSLLLILFMEKRNSIMLIRQVVWHLLYWSSKSLVNG